MNQITSVLVIRKWKDWIFKFPAIFSIEIPKTYKCFMGGRIFNEFGDIFWMILDNFNIFMKISINLIIVGISNSFFHSKKLKIFTKFPVEPQSFSKTLQMHQYTKRASPTAECFICFFAAEEKKGSEKYFVVKFARRKRKNFVN